MNCKGNDTTSGLSRRGFLATSTGSALLLSQSAWADAIASNEGPYQATGTRVGDVTDTSAIVWTRLTKHPQRNNAGVVVSTKEKKGDPPPDTPVAEIEGACPGAAGRLRLRYGLRDDLSDAIETPWNDVAEDADSIHQFHLRDLKPGSTYYYEAQAAAPGHTQPSSTFTGKFSTAPAADAASSVRFCVMTCQGYQDRDHQDGHPIYPSMLEFAPHFVSLTGDLVYYDSNAPRAVTPALARLHWERMFSLPRLVATLRGTSSYWLKDDHDTLSNDAWPGMQAGELSFVEGQEIFHQQAPLGESMYRTFRWGRDLQIWLTEGRDFRSPNTVPDGPEKTIWGAEQKAWFKRTVQASDATWKVLITPTTVVGPDRPTKNDNHANAAFAHEGSEIRQWLKEHAPDNFFIVCGDRHWQHHSVHPVDGTQEFSVGPASNSHAGGFPGENKEFHRFHRVKGGFLAVEVRPLEERSEIVFQLRAVNGRVAYEVRFDRALQSPA